MTPLRRAGRAEANGRFAKAQQFADAAALFVDEAVGEAGEFADAYVTLAVHSGIAASDVICIAKTGYFSPTGSHHESVTALRKVSVEAAKHLDRLLSVKTKAGYADRPASSDDVDKARRAHSAILEIARSLRVA